MTDVKEAFESAKNGDYKPLYLLFKKASESCVKVDGEYVGFSPDSLRAMGCIDGDSPEIIAKNVEKFKIYLEENLS